MSDPETLEFAPVLPVSPLIPGPPVPTDTVYIALVPRVTVPVRAPPAPPPPAPAAFVAPPPPPPPATTRYCTVYSVGKGVGVKVNPPSIVSPENMIAMGYAVNVNVAGTVRLGLV
jgi:hypothetical protein